MFSSVLVVVVGVVKPVMYKNNDYASVIRDKVAHVYDAIPRRG